MKRFFCYALVDGRDKSLFYIGKGQGNRPFDHIKEAKRGIQSDKCARIREVLDAGAEVTVDYLAYFDDEDQAYEFEKQTINQIGRDKLTNATDGGRNPFNYSPADSKEAQDKVVLGVFAKLVNIVYLDKEVPVLNFGGQAIEIPSKVISRCIEMAKEIVNRRGAEWCNKRTNPAIRFE